MSAQILDARGWICPLPVLRARKVLLSLPSGTRLTVLATDKNAPKDFSLFCEEQGHCLKEVRENDNVFEIDVIRA